MPIILENYFKKIKHPFPNMEDMPAEQKIKCLHDIYYAHVLSFPYHNFELREVSLQRVYHRPELTFFSYQNLLSPSHKGGYCYQTVVLLHDVLSQLGLSPNYCMAHTLIGAPVNDPSILSKDPNHILLTVMIDEKLFFLDPGFGSHSPRFPIMVSGSDEIIPQEDDVFKFQKIEAVHVLERKTAQGWLRLSQTNLQAITEAQVNYYLSKIEYAPSVLIRDDKTLIACVTENGRKSLVWDSSSDELKFSKHEKGLYSQIKLSVKDGYKVLQEEFGIPISFVKFEAYCTKTPLIKRPWETPVTSRERLENDPIVKTFLSP